MQYDISRQNRVFFVTIQCQIASLEAIKAEQRSRMGARQQAENSWDD